jgi:LCP family protein required for cell wall assembly
MNKDSKRNIIVACIFAFFSVVSVFAGVHMAKTVKSSTLGQNVGIKMDKVTNVGVTNFLAMGLDCDNTRSDTMMLINFNGKEKKVNILSIPRDTRVIIGRRYQKINAAIGIGKQEVAKGTLKEPEELPIKKVKEIVNVPIHYFATVDFKGFRNIVDVLGGVDYDVPDVEGHGRGMNYDDPAQRLFIHLKPGFQHLDGQQAEWLVRYRHGYAEADIARIKVQQQFLRELAHQKLRPQYFTKIKPLYEEINKNLRTNYTLYDLSEHISLLKDLKAEDIEMFQLPGEPKYIDGVSYFLPNQNETNKLINEHFK